MTMAAISTSTSTNSSPLREYIDQAGDLPGDVLLGRIVLYTITDEPVAHDKLEQWFDELGLDKALMPAEIRELDAFKKATSDVDKNSYPLSGDRTAIALCRPVTTTPDMVVRQITREVRDGRRKKLYYDNAIQARFFRKTRQGGSARISLKINQESVLPEELEPLKALAQGIVQGYSRYVNFHDGQKLRGLVRSYLLHMNAIEIKGGVYFIHVSRDAELSALTELVNRFGGGCMMNTIPIVDLQRERQFITSVFEREASESLATITKKARELLAQSRVTAQAVASIQKEYTDVLQKAQEHMGRLQVTQDVTAASAEVTHDVLQKLANRLGEDA